MLLRATILLVISLMVIGTIEAREKRPGRSDPIFVNPKPLREKPVIEKPVIEKSKKEASVHEKPVFEKTLKTKAQHDKASFDKSQFDPALWDRMLIETRPIDDSGPELEPYPLAKPANKKASRKRVDGARLRIR